MTASYADDTVPPAAEPLPWRVLVTGSRHCTDGQALTVREHLDRATRLFRELAHRRLIVVHGRCPHGGVDLVAHRWAEQMPGVAVEPHPADWGRHGAAAGPRRNTAMVALGADLCVAFPGPGSRGTWDCVRKAADAGIRVEIFPLTGMPG